MQDRVKTVRQNVTLIEARSRKQKEFFDLAKRFRSATDPKEVERLGNELGRKVFTSDTHD
jgi:hypothetical protein